MTEKQLIEKLNKLSEIKPNKQWADLTKKSILGADFVSILNISNNEDNKKISIKTRFTGFVNTISSFNYKTKFAYSLAGMLLLAGTVFSFAQNAVPGDTLFSVRRIAEKFQTTFINDDSSKYNFEIANKRLEDLALIVKDNRTENIAVATNEFKASMLDATNRLINSVKKNPKSMKEVAVEMKKIKENAVLLDKIGGSDLSKESDNLYKVIVEEEIKALENSTLTEDQQKTLVEIKDLYNIGSYSEAFEQILVISN
ncbi:MAG: hypothetical protein A2312_04740 [Candidatus Staskawiczbacteria bacterium RIFOXYB2_FULL_32_9]|uniref:DUF5667 domain-containing protein n=1 Tax=Candidatus Staskawiczbacteria bacterium RIFOXYD1_FULL_32_13 TaxID=1802234 RepID=A0A1G2JQ88_9BACT|nr:MAG: hypothetical protein UR22_C0012G0040 [Parcubacteria group bacterium GW2011_GWC2_32_10]OGZ79246.1 MAG: hypothetical protein A2360_02835 [Candidatus Staskawiczbacteria bacterium RIFOXYB1_FULL_32_11]OGZ79257.1 MAG: hypothetical protein A2256_01170 [Candidatus Staskawiczbacteria bacterium RIFOXYA2_FULL_32_7]OGZ81240.1 MAG: hypothetical protein A2312_04740 [Candidatus Staskawiczbacteria bacterium RIFOXYB2_FULL_32_9]OGZ85031.1 MAG: hypothetical protein A2463_04610 [Candidatus Staskawiczbacter